MSLSPSVEFSTRRLAHAARVKGLPKEAIMGWCSPAEQAVVEEVYAEPIYLNAHLYLRHYGMED
jgi:hypothetical protein